MRPLILGILAILAVLAGPVQAENVLRWSMHGDALTFDPMGQNEGPTFIQNQQVYETLVTLTPEMQLEPALAVSWEVVELTRWVFHLREGVTFQDGRPFTAEDVAFSITRAQHPFSNYLQLVSEIEEVQIIDDHTLNFITYAPAPLLPQKLFSIFMMSKSWSEEHGVVTPQNFSGGEENYAVRNANGTGPFMLELREPDIRTIMVRNPNWWGNEAGIPNDIDRIVFTPIENDATRVAALLSGELDLILDPPLQDLARLERTPGLVLAQVPQIRTIFFGLNQRDDELASSNIRGRNPFQDVRVRRAIYQAINEDAIRDRIMRGRAAPGGMIISPGINGYEEAFDERLPFDQDAARDLLADAGYADGFSVSLDCPNNRYVNDEEICQAAIGMLAQIGITVNLDAQPKSLHFPKIENQVTDFYMLGWTPNTLDSGSVFDYLIGTDGSWNAAGYSNAVVDEMLPRISAEIDPDVRRAMIHDAWQIILDDVAYVPLHNQVLTWAMRDSLDMPITPNNLPQFRWARIEE